MTDTPRTQDELLTIFADNTARAISPQDMRDLVVSVSDPVVGGGFDGIKAFSYGRRNAGNSVLSPELTCAPDSYLNLPLDPALVVADGGNGWVVGNTEWVDPTDYPADTHNLYDIAVAPNAAVMLPPGIYEVWNKSLTLTADTYNYDDNVGMFLDPVIYPDTNPGKWLDGDAFAFVQQQTPERRPARPFLVPADATDQSVTHYGWERFIIDEPWPFGLFLSKFGGSSSVTVQRYSVTVVKLA